MLDDGRRDRAQDVTPTGARIIPYDKRKLSYAGTFTNPVEGEHHPRDGMGDGQADAVARHPPVRGPMGVPDGQAFWAQALDVMGIRLATPDDEIARIPRHGPLIVVANHPHGLVDGMVLAELIGRVRTDYKILTRSLLTEIDEIRRFMIPVPFPHEDTTPRNAAWPCGARRWRTWPRAA
jgi:hypothetical protein